MNFSGKSFLYRNLRTKTWSEKGPNGRVCARPLEVIVANPKLIVSESGRERVRRTRRKVVHAGVKGNIIISLYTAKSSLLTESELKFLGFKEVVYNPYLYDSFVFLDTKEPVFSAGIAYMTSDMKVYIL